MLAKMKRKITADKKTSLALLYLFLLLISLPITNSFTQRKDTTKREASAAGSIYYVSPTGSDSNPGTQTAPFATIQKAASVVTSGTIVYVAPGTYSFSGYIAIPSSASGTSVARTQFVSTTKWGAKVISTGSDRVWQIDGDYIDIKGFDISNPTSTARLGIINYGSYNRALNNYIHDVGLNNTGCPGSGGGGIDDADYTKSHNDEIGNLIVRIAAAGCSGIHGIYHANQYGVVTNNIIADIAGWGIKLYHNASYVQAVNNTIVNAYNGVLIETQPGYPVADHDVVNNNIIAKSFSTSSHAITEGSVNGNTVGSNNTINNNILWKNANGDSVSMLANGGTITNTIITDPKFINGLLDGTGDYHVQTGSPAIDAGTSSNAPSTDFAGNTRPQGGGYDIGAYEYSSATMNTQTSVSDANFPANANPLS